MVFLGFFGWVFLGGFFNANPAYITIYHGKKKVKDIMQLRSRFFVTCFSTVLTVYFFIFCFFCLMINGWPRICLLLYLISKNKNKCLETSEVPVRTVSATFVIFATLAKELLVWPGGDVLDLQTPGVRSGDPQAACRRFDLPIYFKNES